MLQASVELNLALQEFMQVVDDEARVTYWLEKILTFLTKHLDKMVWGIVK